jgi:ATP-dependent Lon protease
MTKDAKQYSSSKKSIGKKTKNDKSKETKRDQLVSKKKQNRDSDSSDFDDDNSSDWEEDDQNEEMDEHEYRKFLSKIFPSKYLNEKVKAGEKMKKAVKEDVKSQDKSNKKVSKKENVVSKKKKEESESESEEESDEDYDTEDEEEDEDYDSEEDEDEEEDSEEEDEEEEEEEEEIKKRSKSKSKTKISKKSKTKSSKKEDSDSEEDSESEEEKPSKKGKKGKEEKVNIILSIGGPEDYDDEEYNEDDEEWESLNDDETEDEDESVSSDEDTECEEEKEDESVVEKEKKSKKTESKKPNKKSVKEEETKTEVSPSSETDEFLKKLEEMYESNKNNKSIQKCIESYKKDREVTKKKREKKETKQKAKNTRIFKRILRDKNTMNDFTFFEKIDLDAQKKMIKELREINKMTRVEKPYRMTLLDASIPPLFKAAAMKRINSLRYMEPGSGDYYKIKTWVDTFMHIPFDQFRTLPINISDGVEKCHDFMENAKQILDSAVYGLNDAKMQIMQMLGQLITNPKAIGTSIAINGPPGTGKTSLVKEGISKILDRPFAFIALGGATDSSFLEGHSYTYEGSIWGKIVQILIDSKCMNPVIYFDELDKISDTPKGEEIAGILTHLTDTTQNSQFHDKYFAEIDFDLSKCLFIFSYNDESKINPILKDRMYRIQTKGYDKKQKTIISNDYLLPRIREQVCFQKEDITIPEETVHYIIENYCNKEDGVRNLKRCLEIIYTKLNLYRLMKPGSNLFE